MSLFEFILAYLVGWWLVLFMVLPWGAHPPSEPGKGHAVSAPAQPRLKKKLLITSLLAFIPPLLFAGVSEALATDPSMFKATSEPTASDCANYQPDDSINATDEDATLGGNASPFEDVPTYLDAPASDYTKNKALQKNAELGVVQLGVVSTNTKTGETTYNGQAIGTTGCK